MPPEDSGEDTSLDDALISHLTSQIEVVALLHDGDMGIGLNSVLPGTKPPYLLVVPSGDDQSYTMGLRVAVGKSSRLLVCITQDSDDFSAPSIARNILRACQRCLHGQILRWHEELPGEEGPIALRAHVIRGARDRVRTHTVSDQEQYHQDGYRYSFLIERDS
jgi:hypothetical protein